MNIEIRDERFREAVGDRLEMERIAAGFIFTEGPAWHPGERHLTFSDIIGSKIYHWAPGEGGAGGKLSVHRSPSNMANGNTYDREGRLLSCEHSTSQVVREEGGELKVIASRYQGKELNSPNDIVVKSDGRIYFTDPPAGRSERYGRFRPQELDFQGFFRVDPDGQNLTLLGKDFILPNGLCFSTDEKRLFVNDTRRKHIRAYDVQPDGLVTGGTVWAEATGRRLAEADRLLATVASLAEEDPEAPARLAEVAQGFAALATAQRQTPAPDAAAAANFHLIDGFAVYADALAVAGSALGNGDAAGVEAAVALAPVATWDGSGVYRVRVMARPTGA